MILAGCTLSIGRPSLPPPAGSTTLPGSAPYNLRAGVKTLAANNQAGTTPVTTASTATIVTHCPGGMYLGDCRMDYQIQLQPSTALTVADDAGRVILHGGFTKAKVTTHASKVSGIGVGRGSFTVATRAADPAFATVPARVKVTTTAGATNVTVPDGASYKVTTSSTTGDQDITLSNHLNAVNVIDQHAQVSHSSLHQG